MSNISRRDFLKTAGVMTLAVAAAGVLAGCEGNKPSDDDTPVQTAVNSATIGAYTVSIKNTVLAQYEEVNNGSITEKQRLYVLVNVTKNTVDSQVDVNFTLSDKHANLTWNAGLNDDGLSPNAMENLFGSSLIEGYSQIIRDSKKNIGSVDTLGRDFCAVYDVNDMTKSNTKYVLIVTPDDTAKKAVELTATIPAAVVYEKSKLEG